MNVKNSSDSGWTLIGSDGPVENAYMSKFQAFRDTCGKFMKWEDCFIQVVSEIGGKCKFKEFHAKLSQLQLKTEKGTLDIVVTGMTSSGKSFLINSLLGEKLLRSSVGHCTPCAVTIQTTDNSSAFYKVDFDGCETPFDITAADSMRNFHRTVDALNKSQDSNRVEVYLPQNTLKGCSVLLKNVIITDNAGMDREKFKDEQTKSLVEQADALVLVIDFVNDLNQKETDRLLNDYSFLVKPNLLVVYNKCDKLEDEEEDLERAGLLIEVALKKISNLLMRGNERCIQKRDAEESIFFISAKEALSRRTGKNSNCSSPPLPPSFGYRKEGERFVTDADEQYAAFMSFERRLLEIASDNFEKMKTERIVNEIDKGLVRLREEAKKLIKLLSEKQECLQRYIDKCQNVPSEEEALETTKSFLFMEVEDKQRFLSGEELINEFMQYCRNQKSDTLVRSESDLRVEDDDHLNAITADAFRRKKISPVLGEDKKKYFSNKFVAMPSQVSVNTNSFEEMQVRHEREIEDEKTEHLRQEEEFKERIEAEERRLHTEKKEEMESLRTKWDDIMRSNDEQMKMLCQEIDEIKKQAEAVRQKINIRMSYISGTSPTEVANPETDNSNQRETKENTVSVETPETQTMGGHTKPYSSNTEHHGNENPAESSSLPSDEISTPDGGHTKIAADKLHPIDTSENCGQNTEGKASLLDKTDSDAIVENPSDLWKNRNANANESREEVHSKVGVAVGDRDESEEVSVEAKSKIIIGTDAQSLYNTGDTEKDTNPSRIEDKLFDKDLPESATGNITATESMVGNIVGGATVRWDKEQSVAMIEGAKQDTEVRRTQDAVEFKRGNPSTVEYEASDDCLNFKEMSHPQVEEEIKRLEANAKTLKHLDQRMSEKERERSSMELRKTELGSSRDTEEYELNKKWTEKYDQLHDRKEKALSHLRSQHTQEANAREVKQKQEEVTEIAKKREEIEKFEAEMKKWREINSQSLSEVYNWWVGQVQQHVRDEFTEHINNLNRARCQLSQLLNDMEKNES